MSDVLTAEDVIRQHDLKPHPEGGWFRETFRDATRPHGRAHSTAILFLRFRAGTRSMRPSFGTGMAGGGAPSQGRTGRRGGETAPAPRRAQAGAPTTPRPRAPGGPRRAARRGGGAG